MAKMLEALGSSVECPVCFEIMLSAIRQCESGHSICEDCAYRVNSCPLCNAAITSRNYQLEDVIANLQKIESNNTDRTGNKRKFEDSDLEDCQHKPQEHAPKTQKFVNFSNHPWKGDVETTCRHFKNHQNSIQMQLQTWNYMKVDETMDYFDIQLIPYNDGEELFWFKHKISAQKKEAYWLFQCVEPKTKTCNYYYEFTLSHSSARTLKIWETCESDRKHMDQLINSGKCITIPFSILRSYIREDKQIYFKFKIGEIKEESENCNQNINQGMGNAYDNNFDSNKILLPHIKVEKPTYINDPGSSCSGNGATQNLPFNGPQNFLHLERLGDTRLEDFTSQIPKQLGKKENFRNAPSLPSNTNFQYYSYQPQQTQPSVSQSNINRGHQCSLPRKNLHNPRSTIPPITSNTSYVKIEHPIPSVSTNFFEESQLRSSVPNTSYINVEHPVPTVTTNFFEESQVPYRSYQPTYGTSSNKNCNFSLQNVQVIENQNFSYINKPSAAAIEAPQNLEYNSHQSRTIERITYKLQPQVPGRLPNSSAQKTPMKLVVEKSTIMKFVEDAEKHQDKFTFIDLTK